MTDSTSEVRIAPMQTLEKDDDVQPFVGYLREVTSLNCCMLAKGNGIQRAAMVPRHGRRWVTLPVAIGPRSLRASSHALPTLNLHQLVFW